MIVYLLWNLATTLARLVPRRIFYAAAGIVADLVFLAWRAGRENSIDNMRHVLAGSTEAKVRRVARQSFRNYGKCLVDFIRCPVLRPEDLDGKLEDMDWGIIESARQQGKGYILALMHFGSWDLGGALFSRSGHVLNVVTDTFEHGRLNQIVVEARTRTGLRVIPLENAAVPILRALRRNEGLGLLMDRPGAENGVQVKFFGSPVTLPSGPARLALRTGARVIPAGVIRIDPDGDRLLAVLDPILDFETSGDGEQDVREMTEAILRAHEALIRRFPDQWYMFRRMWSTC